MRKMKFIQSILCLLWILFPFLTDATELRIIGGSNAPAGHFSFVAAIYVQTEDSRFFCGGAILNTLWIVSSGHCAHNAELFTIQLGSMTLTSSDLERQILSTSEYVLHPEFNLQTLENDIAVIKFRMAISYTTYIQAIQLPPIDVNDGVAVTAVGWGQISDSEGDLSEHLQYVGVTSFSNSECKLVYGNQIRENMVCVAGDYNEGTCIGDSGSPLIEYFGRSYSIVGVASFISGNGCESTDPSGYTRVYPYREWLTNVTRTP